MAVPNDAPAVGVTEKMNDLFADWKNIAIAALGGLVSLGAWIFKGHVRRLEQLEAAAARKQEIEQLREDMDRRHDQNITTLGEIKDAVTGTHQRIDDLYTQLLDRQ